MKHLGYIIIGLLAISAFWSCEITFRVVAENDPAKVSPAPTNIPDDLPTEFGPTRIRLRQLEYADGLGMFAISDSLGRARWDTVLRLSNGRLVIDGDTVRVFDDGIICTGSFNDMMLHTPPPQDSCQMFLIDSTNLLFNFSHEDSLWASVYQDFLIVRDLNHSRTHSPAKGAYFDEPSDDYQLAVGDSLPTHVFLSMAPIDSFDYFIVASAGRYLKTLFSDWPTLADGQYYFDKDTTTAGYITTDPGEDSIRLFRQEGPWIYINVGTGTGGGVAGGGGADGDQISDSLNIVRKEFKDTTYMLYFGQSNMVNRHDETSEPGTFEYIVNPIVQAWQYATNTWETANPAQFNIDEGDGQTLLQKARSHIAYSTALEYAEEHPNTLVRIYGFSDGGEQIERFTPATTGTGETTNNFGLDSLAARTARIDFGDKKVTIILMHQGEANNTTNRAYWCQRVEEVYDTLIGMAQVDSAAVMIIGDFAQSTNTYHPITENVDSFYYVDLRGSSRPIYVARYTCDENTTANPTEPETIDDTHFSSRFIHDVIGPAYYAAWKGRVRGKLQSSYSPFIGFEQTGDNFLGVLGSLNGHNQTGDDVISIGENATNSQTGDNVIGIGTIAAFSNTGNDVIALGNWAARQNTGTGLIAIGGDQAGRRNSGLRVIAMGADNTGRDNAGDESIFIGNGSGEDNAGDNVVAMGNNALAGDGSSTGNVGDNITSVGAFSGVLNNGPDNNFYGNYAGYFNNGGNNTFFAFRSGQFGIGDQNIAGGNLSMEYHRSTGVVSMGYLSSPFQDDTGNSATAVESNVSGGVITLDANVPANWGTVGDMINLNASSTGDYNRQDVYQYEITAVNQITLSGASASSSSDVITFYPNLDISGSVVLGKQAKADGINQIAIGNSDITEAKYGDNLKLKVNETLTGKDGYYHVFDETADQIQLKQTEIWASGTLDFANTDTLSSSDLTITVTGAAVGDPVIIGAPHVAASGGGTFFGWVSAINTVTVRFSNHTLSAIDPTSGTFNIIVRKQP